MNVTRTTRMVARVAVAGLMALGVTAVGAMGAQGAYGATIVALTRAAKGDVYPPPPTVAVDARLGRVFLDNDNANSLGVLDAASGRFLRAVPLRMNLRAIALDERANRVFVVGDSGPVADEAGGVSVLDAANGRVLRTVPVGRYPQNIVVDVPANRAFVMNGDLVSVLNGVPGVVPGVPGVPGSVTMLDATTGRVLRTLTMKEGFVEAAVADGPAGHIFMATATYSARRQTWIYGLSMRDATSGRLLRAITLPPSHGYEPTFVLADDSRTNRVFLTYGSYIALGYGQIVRVFDARTGETVRTITLGTHKINSAGVSPGALAVDEGAGRVYVTGYDVTTYAGRLSILDASSGKVLRTATAGMEPIAVVAAPRLGRLLVVNASYRQGQVVEPGGLTILDAFSGRMLRTVDGGSGTPYCVAVDGQTGLAFEPDPYTDNVSVIDVRSGRLLHTVDGATGRMT